MVLTGSTADEILEPHFASGGSWTWLSLLQVSVAFWLKPFGSGRLGSNPRGQVVGASRLLLSLTTVVSSYLVLQLIHLALLVRVGGIFSLRISSWVV